MGTADGLPGKVSHMEEQPLPGGGPHTTLGPKPALPWAQPPAAQTLRPLRALPHPRCTLVLAPRGGVPMRV